MTNRDKSSGENDFVQPKHVRIIPAEVHEDASARVDRSNADEILRGDVQQDECNNVIDITGAITISKQAETDLSLRDRRKIRQLARAAIQYLNEAIHLPIELHRQVRQDEREARERREY